VRAPIATSAHHTALCDLEPHAFSVRSLLLNPSGSTGASPLLRLAYLVVPKHVANRILPPNASLTRQVTVFIPVLATRFRRQQVGALQGAESLLNARLLPGRRPHCTRPAFSWARAWNSS